MKRPPECIPGAFLSHNDDYSADLNCQYQRHTQNKRKMLCFMAKQIHSQQTANAAADGSHCQQRGFRDPPKFFLGFALVRKHKEVSDGINCKKVKKNQFGHSDSLSGGDRE